MCVSARCHDANSLAFAVGPVSPALTAGKVCAEFVHAASAPTRTAIAGKRENCMCDHPRGQRIESRPRTRPQEGRPAPLILFSFPKADAVRARLHTELWAQIPVH